MDDDYKALYDSENKVAILSQYFSMIAIIISCLGLFGLASFTAQRRQKEIGIRKLMGATDLNIVGFLSADFTKVVMIAIAVAIPISYFIGLKWLNTFAFKIELKWWVFAGAGLSALLIAWFTVGLLTIKASRANPSEYLRSE